MGNRCTQDPGPNYAPVVMTPDLNPRQVSARTLALQVAPASRESLH